MYVEFFGPGASGKTTFSKAVSEKKGFLLRSKNPGYFMRVQSLFPALYYLFIIFFKMVKYRCVNFYFLKEIFLCYLIYFRYKNKNLVSDHGFLHTMFLAFFKEYTVLQKKEELFLKDFLRLIPVQNTKYIFLDVDQKEHTNRVIGRFGSSLTHRECKKRLIFALKNYSRFLIFLKNEHFSFHTIKSNSHNVNYLDFV